MACHLLKMFFVGVVATLIFSSLGAVPSRAADLTNLPTKAHPLFIVFNKRQVLLYTEVNPRNWNKTNPHWGVVYYGGKLSDKAILSAFCTTRGISRCSVANRGPPGKQPDPESSRTLCPRGRIISLSLPARPE